MTRSYEYHPFRRTEIPRSNEFANLMRLLICDASLGSFGSNLWGLAISADVEAESVEAYLWFDEEPSLLDRDEMGEFASAFDNYADGAVALHVHWQVSPQSEHGAIDHSLDWAYLRRDPTFTLPDDFDEIDLKF